MNTYSRMAGRSEIASQFAFFIQAPDVACSVDDFGAEEIFIDLTHTDVTCAVIVL